MDKCRKSHLYTEENTYVRKDGTRECHICRKAYQLVYKKNNHKKLRAKRKIYRDMNKDKISARDRKYREANSDKCREKARTYYYQNKDACKKRMWKYHIKRTYGLTLEEYLRLVEQQNYKCKICQKEVNYRLHVDHDHLTGDIRGLLCTACNWGLGSFMDSIKSLQVAISYLKSEPTGLKVGGRALEELGKE